MREFDHGPLDVYRIAIEYLALADALAAAAEGLVTIPADDRHGAAAERVGLGLGLALALGLVPGFRRAPLTP